MVAERLARHGRVVLQLRADHFAQNFVLWQLFGQVVVIGQLFDFAHAVDQHYFLKFLVGFWVADDAQKRCQTRAGGQQIQALGGQQIVDQQRAGGLFADDDGVAHLDVLQARGQRAVGHFDAQKL